METGTETERTSRISMILKYLRSKKNISQSKLADDLNISRVSMSYYETGSRCPDIDLLIKFADYFGVSLDYLTGRSDVKSIDTDLRAVCEYTGLSEEAVDILRNAEEHKDLNIGVINGLISSFGDYEYENNKYRCIVSKIADYLSLDTDKIYFFKPSENSLIEYEYDRDMPSGIPHANEDIIIRQNVFEELILEEIKGLIIEMKEWLKNKEWREREK